MLVKQFCRSIKMPIILIGVGIPIILLLNSQERLPAEPPPKLSGFQDSSKAAQGAQFLRSSGCAFEFCLHSDLIVPQLFSKF